MQEVWHLMEQQTWFWLLTVALTSLCIGSFLNVVIYRLPIMMQRGWQAECRVILSQEPEQPEPAPFNLMTPGSTCPKCENKIKVHHNIPLLSWLCLKGKCAYCDTPIAKRYPLIELLTGVASVWLAWHFSATPQALVYLLVTWVLIALIFIDIDHMLLPDQLTLPLLWFALLAAVFGITVTPSQAIIGAAVGYLSLWSIYWAFKLLTGKEGMGFGDFKLLAVFGALMGWQSLLLIVLLSSVVGAVIGATQLAMQGKNKATPIPFGPYLAIAGWLTLLYGEQISRWYFSLLGA
ncbi:MULTISPECIES: A24 family peptidase [unclassified Pseudoalteromonas]|uniref:prepilin peptidase n=1 Tax=unclassified Pseudoalteromonas TaxID=194690 RepID=UPI002097624C|nr:A24 family peptidase [Pseudoalteromonas sp. XMcav2-N]MCO7188770.1 A24 family peptidase [Pseudoalteromonas sp. XMcav2-N]